MKYTYNAYAIAATAAITPTTANTHNTLLLLFSSSIFSCFFNKSFALIKANDLLKRQEKIEEEKKCNKVLWVFAVVGVIAAVVAIAYALYVYFTPDYLEDFEDEFDDDFDDDFFEDEEEPVVVKKAEKASDVEE